jgi:hypothetical protein
MNLKIKNNYERTIPELQKKRRGERIACITFAGLTLFYMGFAMYTYFTTGLVGITVLLCTIVIIGYLAATDSNAQVRDINHWIYIREHEECQTANTELKHTKL